MIVRIGTLTQTKSGKGRVKYTEMDNTSKWLPFVTFNEELSYPEIGDTVLTLHKDNSSCTGFILGTYWSSSHAPSDMTMTYCKLLKNGCYIKQSDGKIRLISSDELILTGACGTITLTNIMSLLNRTAELENIVSRQTTLISELQEKIEELTGEENTTGV